ncbi:His-Xaa-Ser system protein HxsD [Pseudomonas nitritireducens]|uniref:His-Xaa-Ser system protein HxsD n=1 Tax=Pseudomonas nitroreducens TaxID=46680 RepID=A0A7W7KP85_PSENT|nr:His-Xaa-Ser system protein HxsD [Pseudomonas nitritireducens]MBB4865743.1 His-Xaa-Ser system protein HxsD [Pseudomonas nitritireducens]
MTWPVILQLDERSYSASVVQRAAYSVASDFIAEIQVQGQRIVVLLNPHPSSTVAATLCADQVKGRLLQQLNDFALRERIQQETAGLREALIRAALIGCSI